MVENILILGNGFDLAMGRKTSYGDFLRFLNSISVQSSNSEEFFDTNIIDGLIQEKKIEKDDYFSKISKNLFLKYINEVYPKKENSKDFKSINLLFNKRLNNYQIPRIEDPNDDNQKKTLEEFKELLRKIDEKLDISSHQDQ